MNLKQAATTDGAKKIFEDILSPFRTSDLKVLFKSFGDDYSIVLCHKNDCRIDISITAKLNRSDTVTVAGKKWVAVQYSVRMSWSGVQNASDLDEVAEVMAIYNKGLELARKLKCACAELYRTQV